MKIEYRSSIDYGGTSALGTFFEQFLSMGVPAHLAHFLEQFLSMGVPAHLAHFWSNLIARGYQHTLWKLYFGKFVWTI